MRLVERLLRFVSYSLRIRRIEYRVAEIPILLIPVFLTITDVNVFRLWTFWEGVIIFFLMFAFGDLVNCLADRDLDAVYKPKLTEAVYGLGLNNVRWQAGLSAVAALALAVDLSIRTQRWLLLPGTLLGLVTAYVYSVPPIRLKGRGLWQLAFYWLGLFVSPMSFSAFVVADNPPWETYAVALAYGWVQTGVLLVNTAEDYPEDKHENIQTAIVAMGLQMGIFVASLIALSGTCVLLSVICGVFASRHVPSMAWLGIVPLGVATIGTNASILSLATRIRRKELPDAITTVKRSARFVPAWITSVALATLVAALVAHFARRT